MKRYIGKRRIRWGSYLLLLLLVFFGSAILALGLLALAAVLR